MNNISTQIFKTPHGELILGSFDDQLCLCDWRYRKMRAAIDKRIQEGLNATYIEDESNIIRAAMQKLIEYFNGDRKEFDIPLRMVGTSFQQKVWNELLNIPFGKKYTYLTLTRKIGDDKAIRAVAAANGANAISIFIPCHRIIGSRGELTGYAGGIHVKNKLLQLESGNPAAEQLELFD